mmetsp:Transcript_2950/g.7075  ORF Transcript_2950/g.7075 Transcript_2950/m.7075 type:complete len:169 (-) Transcript_2950:28-534(-)
MAAAIRTGMSTSASARRPSPLSVAADEILSPPVSPTALHVKYSSRPPTQMSMVARSSARRQVIRGMLKGRAAGAHDNEELIAMVQDEIARLHDAKDELSELEEKLLGSINTITAARRSRNERNLGAAASFNRFSMRNPNKQVVTKFVTSQPEISNSLSRSKVKTVFGR